MRPVFLALILTVVLVCPAYAEWEIRVDRFADGAIVASESNEVPDGARLTVAGLPMRVLCEVESNPMSATVSCGVPDSAIRFNATAVTPQVSGDVSGAYVWLTLFDPVSDSTYLVGLRYAGIKS